MPCPPQEDLPNPGIEPRSPTLQADSLLSESPGENLQKSLQWEGSHSYGSSPGFWALSFLTHTRSHRPKSTGVGRLSLHQGIFPTQESNQGLLPCRRILYQLSYHPTHTHKEKKLRVSIHLVSAIVEIIHFYNSFVLSVFSNFSHKTHYCVCNLEKLRLGGKWTQSHTCFTVCLREAGLELSP